MDSASRSRIRRSLLRWYGANQRDLPWRRNTDPYRVWLSEIMLQQTRVAVVVDYYQRFLRRFPNIERLAAARESTVVAAWSGLGYYRRARALHRAARKILKEYHGEFPRTAADWRELPGIGRYTAAAIASIAFHEPVAAVDSNVQRVLCRLVGKPLAGAALWQAAHSLLSRRQPGDFNQAIMELGATVCLPRKPKCPLCPVLEMCATRGELAKAPSKVRSRREIHYALNRRGDRVLLVSRPANCSLLPGMWELPETMRSRGGQPIVTLRHSITATDYVVRVLPGCSTDVLEGRWVRKDRLTMLPLTGLTRKILRTTKII